MGVGTQKWGWGGPQTPEAGSDLEAGKAGRDHIIQSWLWTGGHAPGYQGVVSGSPGCPAQPSARDSSCPVLRGVESALLDPLQWEVRELDAQRSGSTGQRSEDGNSDVRGEGSEMEASLTKWLVKPLFSSMSAMLAETATSSGSCSKSLQEAQDKSQSRPWCVPGLPGVGSGHPASLLTPHLLPGLAAGTMGWT